MDKNIWQLQEAKAKFSALVRAAERYPQIITVHKKRKMVLLTLPQFRRLLRLLEMRK